MSYVCYIKKGRYYYRQPKNEADKQKIINECRDNDIICVTVEIIPSDRIKTVYQIDCYCDNFSSAKIDTYSGYQRSVLIPRLVKGLVFGVYPLGEHVNRRDIREEWEKLNNRYTTSKYYADEYENKKNDIMDTHQKYMKEERKYVKDGGDINDPNFLRNYEYYVHSEERKKKNMDDYARLGCVSEEENAFRKSRNKKVVAKKQPPKKRTSDNDFMNKISRFTGIKF